MRHLLSTLLFVGLAYACTATAQEGAVQRLAEAVRYKTISYQEKERIDAAEFQRFHQFLRAAYPGVFSSLIVEVINDYSLLLRWPGADAAASPVLFTAHLDVVPVEPGTEEDWTHPPFAGVVADGNIYGRGTLDDKQGMLGWLEAVESLLAEGFEPDRTLVFGFGHDEEIGGREGAAAMAARMRELGLNFEWMIDEGGMIITDNPLLPGREVALINVAEKGYITLTLTAVGEGGHSSNPPEISTIGRLSAALARLENNPFPPRLSAPVRAMFETIAPHVGLPERLLFSNLWLTDFLIASQMADDRLTSSFVRTTTALTMFNAGVKENVVPQRAEAKVNFRLLPGDTPEALVERVTEIVDDPGIAITTSFWNNIPPVSDHEGAGFQVIATALAAVYPDAVAVPSLLTATTDTRHYIGLSGDQYRFTPVSMASASVSSIHGTDEYIGVDSYLASIETARHILRHAALRGAQAK